MASSAKLGFSRLLQHNLMQLCTRRALLHTQPACLSSFRSSKELQPLEQYPDIEVLHNPPEWKYVERLLPPTLVPAPVAKPAYPSGWQPATADGTAEGYLVARTKNHMVPVYLQTRFRGERRITVVRRIQGNIWALEQELREVVQRARNGKICATRVNELSGQIHIHGDYVDILREHLKSKGF